MSNEPPPTSSSAVCILCIGMAGSGKTTFVQRIAAHLNSSRKQPYILNLDPAVLGVPYSCNIDIRDTVNYCQLMNQYKLGPNGAILTALNLFTTKFDQVLGYLQNRSSVTDYIITDTPGQIEIFTWSASGAIITDAVASCIPTVIAYIIDTPRTTAPPTFMSNMLYACSILYKTRLPFILVFNKIDVQPHDFALDWMNDFEAFQHALISNPLRAGSSQAEGGGSGSYMNSLMNSMSLVLDEFYKNLRAVGCSAITGQGMTEFFEAVQQAKQEYETDYKPELIKRQNKAKEKKEKAMNQNLNKFMKDLKIDPSSRKSTQTSMDGHDNEDDVRTRLRPEELETAVWDEPNGDIVDRQDLDSSDKPIFGKTRSNQPASLPNQTGIDDDRLGAKWPVPR